MFGAPRLATWNVAHSGHHVVLAAFVPDIADAGHVDDELLLVVAVVVFAPLRETELAQTGHPGSELPLGAVGSAGPYASILRVGAADPATAIQL